MTSNLRGAFARLRRMAGTDIRLLVGWLLVVLGALALLLIGNAVSAGEANAVDERILSALRVPGRPHEPIGPPWLHTAVRDVSALGSAVVLSLIVAAVAGYLVLSHRRHAAVWLLVSTSGGAALSFALKEIFGRERPALVPHLTYVASESFPSGHAMLSAVVYLTLGALLTRLTRSLALRIYVVCVALMLSILAGASRVYLGVHYPTDVLAGWVAGTSWAVLAWVMTLHLQRVGRVERESG